MKNRTSEFCSFSFQFGNVQKIKSNVAVGNRDDYLLLFFVLKKVCHNVLLPIIKKRVTQPHGQATQVNNIQCANNVAATAVTDNK